MNENKHRSRELPDPRILSPKYGQTGNVKPLTANRSLSFAVKWPNHDLKVPSFGMIWIRITDPRPLEW